MYGERESREIEKKKNTHTPTQLFFFVSIIKQYMKMLLNLYVSAYFFKILKSQI